MSVRLKIAVVLEENSSSHRSRPPHRSLIFSLLFGILFTAFCIFGQDQAPDWQKQVRKYSEAQDWVAALRVVDREVALAPQDLDVRAWRARVLGWSGRLTEAETEYLAILNGTQKDPDIWMGLANVYSREGRIEEALRTLETAVQLDPTRTDLHAAYARALRAAGKRIESRLEFQKALQLDPNSSEAQAGLISLRPEPKQELVIGLDNDFFNFADANHGEWLSLASQWTPHWGTTVAGNFYQRAGVGAGKFVGSVTRRQAKWGAITIGGAIGHDNAVIPRSEAFFDLDHGWKTGETSFVRGLEISYGQHWYWYQSSRILTLTSNFIAYLPREWMLTLGVTGARSAFSGQGAEWRPSGITRLGFPLAGMGGHMLSGNLSFATGTEDFAEVDQIGSFASRTYGSGLRFQITPRQALTGYGSYQMRTQNRTDTAFGFAYAIDF